MFLLGRNFVHGVHWTALQNSQGCGAGTHVFLPRRGGEHDYDITWRLDAGSVPGRAQRCDRRRSLRLRVRPRQSCSYNQRYLAHRQRHAVRLDRSTVRPLHARRRRRWAVKILLLFPGFLFVRKIFTGLLKYSCILCSLQSFTEQNCLHLYRCLPGKKK